MVDWFDVVVEAAISKSAAFFWGLAARYADEKSKSEVWAFDPGTEGGWETKEMRFAKFRLGI
jgi:hypothetical protein